MVTNEMMKNFKERFESDLSSKVISNAIAKNGIQDSSINNDALRFHNFKFSDSVKKAEITNQKKSGRCWRLPARHRQRGGPARPPRRRPGGRRQERRRRRPARPGGPP